VCFGCGSTPSAPPPPPPPKFPIIIGASNLPSWYHTRWTISHLSTYLTILDTNLADLCYHHQGNLSAIQQRSVANDLACSRTVPCSRPSITITSVSAMISLLCVRNLTSRSWLFGIQMNRCQIEDFRNVVWEEGTELARNQPRMGQRKRIKQTTWRKLSNSV